MPSEPLFRGIRKSLARDTVVSVDPVRPAGEPLVDAWTRYWQSGKSDSCVDRETGAQALAATWREFFERLDPDASVLDLATGNGAVVDVALEVTLARGARLRLTGIDAADIRPARAAGTEVAYLPRVRMESLPFAAGAFDAVVSQFGFEYGQRSLCAAEAARVLKPGGLLRLVVHARNGAVHGAILRRVERLQRVLSPDGLFTTLLAAAREEAAAARRTEEALATKWSEIAPVLAEAPADDAAPFYAEGVTKLWRARTRYAPEDVLASLEDACARAEAVLLRQQALLQAACSDAEMAAIRTHFEASGVKTDEASAVRDGDGAQIGWLLYGVKAP